MSRVELDKIIPVSPPNVNNIIKPKVHHKEAVFKEFLPYKVLNQLKILIPVGTAIIIVAAVK
jgi:hypothetical protein